MAPSATPAGKDRNGIAGRGEECLLRAMKFRAPLFSALVFIVPAVVTAAQFEGVVKEKMTDPHGGARNLEFHIKDNLVRVEMEIGKKGETMSIIYDTPKNQAIMLMPGQNMYMTYSLSDVMGAAEKMSKSDEVSFDKTGDKEKILGYTCEKYVAKNKDATTEIWATDELGRFMGVGGGMGPMGKSKASPAWEKMLAGKDFFPLRVVSKNPKGAETFRMEATSIEKAPQAASLFAPPPGAQKFDLGGMMKGLLPGRNN